MFPFILQSGLTETVVDFTPELSPLLLGLIALLSLSAAGIAWEVLRAYRARPRTHGTPHTPRVTSPRKAA
jgi:hypothetical protein